VAEAARKCGNEECGRKTFTESLPGVPARCRLTERLRGLAGAEVAGRGCTVAEAARWQRVSWPVAHQAFTRQVLPDILGWLAAGTPRALTGRAGGVPD
jgi:transposase